MKDEKYLKPREAARRLGISLQLVYQLLWTGKLEGVNDHGRWKIPIEAVEERLSRRP